MVFIIATFIILGPLIIFYLWLVNEAIVRLPEPIQKISPRRWTEREMKETYERVSKKPIDFAPHLPPKLERRYIVVGGSGKSLSFASGVSHTR
jgi:hypothetical protein